MRIRKKKAFSLTELLIVVVIIALLFAAMAPIITKRRINELTESESIWNFVSNDSERDVFFDPGVDTWTSSLFIGYTPTKKDSSYGKLVINSPDEVSYNGEKHSVPQMQFRFSHDSKQQDKGVNTANLLLTNRNVFFGSDMTLSSSGSNNTIYGMSNLVNLPSTSKPNSVTAMGANALNRADINFSNSPLIAIGHRAGALLGYNSEKENNTNNSKPVHNIYIGSGAGSGAAAVTQIPYDDIAIGYQSMANDGNIGYGNVFLGANTGNGFNDVNSSNNTIVGSSYQGTEASQNTIIGYGVYTKPHAQSPKKAKNITAIGYGACNAINNTSSTVKVTCLGYNSAYTSRNAPIESLKNGEHIFIGGTPNEPSGSRAFPGRSVLEVHNIGGATRTGNVILNSNLVIRGNFFPSDDNGNVSYNTFTTTRAISTDYNYYRCSKEYTHAAGIPIDILSYKGFACSEIPDNYSSESKSINVLKYGNKCSVDDGYPKGNGCPDVVSSDIRLKTNISENNDGLEKILQLTPYNYTYISDKTSTPQVGVIAQDLEKVFSNSVTKNNEGFLKIRWDEMFYAMINSIKQLGTKIENLSSKIVGISKDIISIQTKQKNIQKEISALNKRINRLERK